MSRLLSDFGAVAALTLLALLTLITVTLAGVFDTLPESQAAFLGTLAGALVGFLGLLAGALINAHLNRRLILEDEDKRRESCLRELFSRVRSLTTTVALIARTIQTADQVTADSLAALEHVIDDVRPRHLPDIRLTDKLVLSEFHDLNANLSAAIYMSIAPIKACQSVNRVYQAHPQAIGDLVVGLEQFLGQAVAFRKLIASRLGVADRGPSSIDDVRGGVFPVDLSVSKAS